MIRIRWVALVCLFGSYAFAGDFTLISIPPAETTGYPGSPLLISVMGRSESGADIQYQWKKDGRVLAGETGHMLLVKKASAKSAGVYSVDVTSGSETKSAQTKVVMNKTKLPVQKRLPATSSPAVASCHDTPAAEPSAKTSENHSSSQQSASQALHSKSQGKGKAQDKPSAHADHGHHDDHSRHNDQGHHEAHGHDVDHDHH